MKRLYDTLAMMAVVLTPVAMMAALGWSVYAAIFVLTQTMWISVLSGAATALALEALGIVAGETALRLHSMEDKRWRLAGFVLVLYVAYGVHSLRDTPMMWLPILAGAVYLLIGLRAQTEREEVLASVSDQRRDEWEREQWRIEQEGKTRVKLAQVEARVQGSRQGASTVGIEAALEQILASRVPAQSEESQHVSQHTCEDCGKGFGSVQGLNAHRRFCAGAVEVVAVAERMNGHQ